MTLPRRMGLAVLCLSAVFAGGFFYGQEFGRRAVVEEALEAFQGREEINHDVSDLDRIGLCVALGGLRQECARLMRRLDTASESEQPGAHGRQ